MADEIIAYDFGLRLRQLREEKHFSRASLARKLGVSPETIYRYEHNIQTPSLERAKQMAVLLHTSLDYLVGLESAYTVRLPALSDQQRTVLLEFLSTFVPHSP